MLLQKLYVIPDGKLGFGKVIDTFIGRLPVLVMFNSRKVKLRYLFGRILCLGLTKKLRELRFYSGTLR